MVGGYIVDFVCLKQSLVIELDGSQHLNNQECDQIRTEFLNSLGFRVLRFWNHEVFQTFNLVLNTIHYYLSKPHQPSSGASHHLLPSSGEG